MNRLMKIIANTTVISNFAAVQRLDVLRVVLHEVHISTEVYAEIQDGLAEGNEFYTDLESQIYPLSPDGWLHLTSFETDEELRLFSQLPAALHRGEASCLAIAARRGWAFFSDDARARQAGRELNVVVSGTLGVLVRAVRKSSLSLENANALLEKMIRAGYHSPYTDLADLL